jgi:hypothetical protein
VVPDSQVGRSVGQALALAAQTAELHLYGVSGSLQPGKIGHNEESFLHEPS